MEFINYLRKHIVYDTFINSIPLQDLQTIVVIPCFNEPGLIASLQSLWEADLPTKPVEIIVVINSGEKATSNELSQNEKSIAEFNRWIVNHQKPEKQFHLIHVTGLPHKIAGVGMARKIGMDEAVRRFEITENYNGIIVGFDADATCAPNYFCEIENYFDQHPKINCASLYFEHPVDGSEFDANLYQSIIQYELYLRYYIQALRFAKFPFAYHTIGSSFAVRAAAYMSQGGMNRKKAGEDFYFLQKLIPLGKFGEIKTTTVFPSPRPSDRVPFGTGASMQKMIDEKQEVYFTYNFDAFILLKDFLLRIDILFKADSEKYTGFLNHIEPVFKDFLNQNSFFESLVEINNHSPEIKTFYKRFYQWFDAFRVLKFMNFAHENVFQKMPVTESAIKLLRFSGSNNILTGAKDLLMVYRRMEKV